MASFVLGEEIVLAECAFVTLIGLARIVHAV